METDPILCQRVEELLKDRDDAATQLREVSDFLNRKIERQQSRISDLESVAELALRYVNHPHSNSTRKLLKSLARALRRAGYEVEMQPRLPESVRQTKNLCHQIQELKTENAALKEELRK